jgi:hypothetical protein
VLHRDVDDPVAPLLRVDRAFGPGRRTVAAHVRHIVEPERPPVISAEASISVAPRALVPRATFRSCRRGSGRPVLPASRDALCTFVAPAVHRSVLRPSGDPWFACQPRGLPAPSGGGPRRDDLAIVPVGLPDRVSRPSSAPGIHTRLSDLAASPPCRFPRMRRLHPFGVATAGRLRRLVRSLLLAFQPLGAMRNVQTASETVKPAFPQVTPRMRRSNV